MTPAALSAALPPHPGTPSFPEHLLGAFRRRSITFCTGATDDTSVVYWFQSRSFTIDMRLPDAATTPLAMRQGWIGDTAWDAASGEMSWHTPTSYQPRNQWPEPARLVAIGNSVIEFAPSGAYVEDWRQQAVRGPLLGLRLIEAVDRGNGARLAMDGGLIVAGDHAAWALSRTPDAAAAVARSGDIGTALDTGDITAEQVESYEVSVATGDGTVRHSTIAARYGTSLLGGEMAIEQDGTIIWRDLPQAPALRLRFAIDLHHPDATFGNATICDRGAMTWIERESAHLMRHAATIR
jgi:hypothetical protein